MKFIEEMAVVVSTNNEMFIGYLHGISDDCRALLKHAVKVSSDQSPKDMAENGVRSGNVTILDTISVEVKEFYQCKI